MKGTPTAAAVAAPASGVAPNRGQPPAPRSRRSMLAILGGVLAGWALLPLRRARGAAASNGAPKGYDPTQHRWLMSFDVDRCIGCGLCVQACKKENHVPAGPTYFRTWIERYIIKRRQPGSTRTRGETLVDSPNGGMDGFPPVAVPREDILRSFFVPKICNLCEHSPCTQACPVGATFDAPDGAVLIDKDYCIGCGFCIQTCPYGCRFMNPHTRTADKCNLCYHRITRGLKPVCVEVCPGGARIFGDLKNPQPNDPIQRLIEGNRVHSIKEHLGTAPRVVYANLDKVVR